MNKSDQNPYVGPRTFLKEEGHLFFGREREARDLAALVASERLVLFYAQSGAGKSSLINTRLIPDLEEKLYEVLPVARVSGDSAEGVDVENIYIFNLIRSLLDRETNPHLLSNLPLPQFLEKLNEDENGYFYDQELVVSIRASLSATPWPRALIIDQFEEIFSTHVEAWQKREDFFCQLAQAMQDDPYLRIVLVMREDYIAALDPYAHILPGGLRMRYYMQRLSREAAIQAVRNPVENLRPYAVGVAEKLVEDLSSIKVQKPDGTTGSEPGQYIEPVQLQVVCYGLWEDLSPEGTQITETDLKEAGDVNQSLGKFYDRRVKEVTEAKQVKERLIREWFEKKLITVGGIRNIVLQERETKPGELDDDVIQALQSDLVRAEKRGGATWYELTHDRLVEPILERNKAWFSENLSPLQRQAALWNQQDRNESWLLTGSALDEVEQWASANQDELTEVENEFLAACRKQQDFLLDQEERQRRELELTQKFAAQQTRSLRISRIITAVAIVAFISSIVAAFFALRLQREAEAAQALADQRADVTRARELASLANEKASEQLDLSMLLSVEAYQITQRNPEAVSLEAQSAVFDTVQRVSRLHGFLANFDEPASQFRFSPDGKYIAAIKQVGDKEKLVLWNLNEDLSEGRELITGAVDEFLFTQDNRYIMFLNREGVHVWNLAEDREEILINEHIGEVSQVIPSLNGSSFATLGENGELTLRDIRALEETSSPLHGDVVAFSPVGEKFAVFENMGIITLGTITTGAAQPLTINADPYSVTSMSFSPDGNVLAVADKDRTITLWDISNNQATEISSFTIRLVGRIENMAFAPNGNLVIYSAPDGVKFFDNRGTEVASILPDLAKNVIFSQNGTMLAVADSVSTLRLYNMESGDPIDSNNSFTAGPAEFTSDSAHLAVFDLDENIIRLLDTANGSQVTQIGNPFHESDGSVVSLEFNSDASLLAVASEEGTITIVNVNSRSILASLRDQNKAAVASMAFNPIGTQLIGGRKDGTVTIWNFNDDTSETRETGYRGRIKSFGLSPDGKILYSVSKNSVVLLRPEDLSVAGIFPANQTRDFEPPRFMAENEMLGVFEASNQINIWNIETGIQLAKLQYEQIEFDPTNQYIAALDNNRQITQLLQVSTGMVFDGMQGQPFVSFSRKGKFLLTSSVEATGELNLWGTETGEQVGAPIPILFLTYYFSPDDTLLFTSSIQGQFDMRDTSTGELIGPPIEGDVIHAINDDSTRLIAYSNLTSLFALWNLETYEPISQRNAPGSTISIRPDGRTIVVSNYSGTSLWDFETGEMLAGPIEGTITTFSTDGEIMAVSAGAKVTLWDMSEMNSIGQPFTGSAFVGLSPSGKFIVLKPASGTGDTLIVADSLSGRQVGGPIQGLSGPVGNVYFNSAGTIKAVRGEDRWISIFGQNPSFIPLSQGFLLPPVQGSITPLPGSAPLPQDTLIFSPDETRMAIFSPDGLLTLWDITAPTMPNNGVIDFDESVTSALISPNGNILGLVSREGVALWDLTTDSPLVNLSSSHRAETTDLYLNPNGETLVASHSREAEPYIILWEIGSGEQRSNSIREAFCGFSPDGQLLITAPNATTYSYNISSYSYSSYCSSNSSLYTVRDADTGEQIGDPIFGLPTYSQNGEYLILPSIGTPGFNVMKVSEGDGSLELSPVGDPIPGYFLQFALGGQAVISNENGRIKLWNIDPEIRIDPVDITLPGEFFTTAVDGAVVILRQPPIPPSTTYTFLLWDLKEQKQIGQDIQNVVDYYPNVSPKGNYLSAHTIEGDFIILDLETGSKESLPGTIFTFSPDDRFMVITNVSKEMEVWDTNTMRMASGPFEGTFGGFFGPNNQVISFRDANNDHILYNTISGERIGEVPRSDMLLFSPDGKFFVTHLFSSGSSLWETTSVRRIGNSIPGQVIGFSPDSRTLVTTAASPGQNNSEISFWDTETGNRHGNPFAYRGLQNGIRFSQDGRLLAVFGTATTYVWDLSEGNISPIEITGVSGSIHRLVFNSDSTMLATLGSDGIIMWDISQPSEPRQIPPMLTGETSRIADLRFTQEGIAYLDANGKFYQSVNGKSSEKTFNNTCMALSSDGKHLSYISGNELRIWDTNLNDFVVMDNDISCVGTVALSSDGSGIAYAEGNRVHVLLIEESGQTPKTVDFSGGGHFNSVKDLTFVLGKQILAVNGEDDRIIFWDLQENTHLGTFDQPGVVERYADSELQIYLASERRLIKMNFNPASWRQALAEWQAELCRKAGRHLTEEEWQQYFEGLYPRNPTCPMPAPVFTD